LIDLFDPIVTEEDVFVHFWATDLIEIKVMDWLLGCSLEPWIGIGEENLLHWSKLSNADQQEE